MNPELPQSPERLHHYTYRDNRASGKVIFECDAENILNADKKFEAATGINPEKQNYIGCVIEEIL